MGSTSILRKLCWTALLSKVRMTSNAKCLVQLWNSLGANETTCLVYICTHIIYVIHLFFYPCLSFSCRSLPSPLCAMLWATHSGYCFHAQWTPMDHRRQGAGKGEALSPHPPHGAPGGIPGSGCISSIFPAGSYEAPGPTGGLDCWVLGALPLPHGMALPLWGWGVGVASCCVNLWFASLLPV